MGLLDEWRHCPRCAAAIEPRNGQAECPSCGYVAYANPVPAACALCVDGAGRILLYGDSHRGIDAAKLAAAAMAHALYLEEAEKHSRPAPELTPPKI